MYVNKIIIKKIIKVNDRTKWKHKDFYKFNLLLQFDFVSSSKYNKGKYHCSFFIFRKDAANVKAIVRKYLAGADPPKKGDSSLFSQKCKQSLQKCRISMSLATIFCTQNIDNRFFFNLAKSNYLRLDKNKTMFLLYRETF